MKFAALAACLAIVLVGHTAESVHGTEHAELASLEGQDGDGQGEPGVKGELLYCVGDEAPAAARSAAWAAGGDLCFSTERYSEPALLIPLAPPAVAENVAATLKRLGQMVKGTPSHQASTATATAPQQPPSRNAVPSPFAKLQVSTALEREFTPALWNSWEREAQAQVATHTRQNNESCIIPER